jgi:hypothetical protein
VKQLLIYFTLIFTSFFRVIVVILTLGITWRKENNQISTLKMVTNQLLNVNRWKEAVLQNVVNHTNKINVNTKPIRYQRLEK